MENEDSKNIVAEFQKRLFASRFFTISILFHAILVLVLGSTALYRAMDDVPDFSGDGGDGTPGLVSDDMPDQLPPDPIQQPVEQPQFEVTTTQSAPTTNIDAITSTGASDINFSLPSFSNLPTTPNTPITQSTGTVGPTSSSFPTTSTQQLSRQQLSAIRGFTDGWVKKGQGSGPGSDPRVREVVFTAYLAKYRNGNWDSTNLVRNGKIVKGSLSNLIYMMNRRSKDRIQALPNAVPLDLSSNEIFEKKPPFIFFTGHRDFTLTEQEVENLRKYVTLGGCIWGDSSLPGHRSRFDIAFRREMRRVIPDKDKDWEALPANHPLYTRKANLYYPEITAPPPGMNHYAEPVYALKFGSEVAVIYTANDYGDMWQIALTPDWKYDTSRDKEGHFIAMSDRFWHWREIYYRNTSEEAVAATYKFGTNLVFHLITRWEEHTRHVPVGL